MPFGPRNPILLAISAALFDSGARWLREDSRVAQHETDWQKVLDVCTRPRECHQEQLALPTCTATVENEVEEGVEKTVKEYVVLAGVTITSVIQVGSVLRQLRCVCARRRQHDAGGIAPTRRGGGLVA